MMELLEALKADLNAGAHSKHDLNVTFSSDGELLIFGESLESNDEWCTAALPTYMESPIEWDHLTNYVMLETLRNLTTEYFIVPISDDVDGEALGWTVLVRK